MSSIRIKSIGKEKVHFKDPSKKHDLVEMVFVDARGTNHTAKFTLEDLRDALKDLGDQEVLIEAVYTKADQFEIVR